MSDDTIASLEQFFSNEKSDDSHEEQPEEEVESEEEETEDEPESDEHDDDSEEDDESTADDDDEDESDDEEEDDDEDSPERTSIDDDDFTVMVDGEEVTVKGSELKSGYMRQSAFTKKTQELASERKQLSSTLGEVSEQANVVKFQAHSRLSELDAAVKQNGGWEAVRRNYPADQVAQFQELYVNTQREADAATAIQKEVTEKAHTLAAQEVRDTVTGLMQTNSAFTQDSVSKLADYLGKHGYTDEMALAMKTPEAWEVAMKAMKYDEAQSRAKGDKTTAKTAKIKSRKTHSVPAKPLPKDGKSRKVAKAIDAQRKSVGKGKAHEKATEAALAALLG